jgi:hypothetical protein
MYLNAAGVRARIRPATAGDATTGSEGRATGPRRLVGLVAPRSAMPIWWSPTGPPPCKAMRLHSGNFSPNIGNPLCDSALVASSCSTSQCSTRTPPAIRTMSAAIRCAPNQIEQTVPSGLDVRAMLNVVRRPVLIRRLVIPFIEQRIERLENQFLLLFFRIGSHFLTPSLPCFAVV